MWCLTCQVQDLPVLMLNSSLMVQEKLYQWILRMHEEESRLTVADIMSHIQVHPWNHVNHGAAFFPENMLWFWLALLFFFGEDTLDLVYIILSFLCICIGSYLVPYLFLSLCSIYLYGSPSWGPGFSKHTRYTSYCTGAMLGNGLSCWELLEWDVKLCLVNAIKYDFRKNCRWISCYYHTGSIG